MSDYTKDKQYQAYIQVVNAASGNANLNPYFINGVKDAMREYARTWYHMATPRSMSQAIVAQDDTMLMLAIHRWRTASANFSQEDHNASLAWRAKNDPVYIKEMSRKNKMQGDD